MVESRTTATPGNIPQSINGSDASIATRKCQILTLKNKHRFVFSHCLILNDYVYIWRNKRIMN